MEGLADLGQQLGRQLGVLALMQGLDAFDRAELGCQLVSQVPIADEANGRLDIALFISCNQPIRQAKAPIKGLINRFKQVGALHAHANNAIEQDIDNAIAIAIAKGVGVEGQITIGYI
jgi:hypothetical protein